MRTVVIQFHEEFSNVTEGNRKQVEAGIGYLSCWAVSSSKYAHLDLYGDKDGCLQGNYREKFPGEITYQLFGLRGEDGSYSFHS